LLKGSTTIDSRRAADGAAGVAVAVVDGAIPTRVTRSGQPRRRRRLRGRQRGDGIGGERVDADRAGDVLDALLAAILEGQGQPVADLIAHCRRDADAARVGQVFEPRRNVHRIAIEVLVVDDYVAEVDPDSEPDAPVICDIGVAFDHPLLRLDRPAHRFDRARKLDEEAVAGGLDDAPAVPGDARVDQLAPARLELGERPFLVRPHQPRIAGDIGGNDRGELPFGLLDGGGG
jgi:hypothetical protein